MKAKFLHIYADWPRYPTRRQRLRTKSGVAERQQQRVPSSAPGRLSGTVRQVRVMVEGRPQVDPALGMGLGTPAAAALMPGGAAAGDGLPTVARMFNLYQPYDPVAYRRAPADSICRVRPAAVQVTGSDFQW